MTEGKSRFIQFLTVYHKPGVLFKGPTHTPIHVGRALAERSGLDAQDLAWMRANMIGDDTGDNISALNPQYRELTGYYWAWKHYAALGDPEYIGFMHYRRHLRLDLVGDAPWNAVLREAATAEYLAETDFSEDAARRLLDGADAVYAVHRRLGTPLSATQFGNFHYRRWYAAALDLFRRRDPASVGLLERYLEGRRYLPYNMFILPRERFFRYAEWYFGILLEVGAAMEREGIYYSAAHFGEMLADIYRAKLEAEGARIRQVRISFMENSGYSGQLRPPAGKDAVSVAVPLASAGTPHFLAALDTWRGRLPAGRLLDLLVLDNGFSGANRQAIFSRRSENLSIRFADVSWALPGLDRLRERGHDAVDAMSAIFLARALPGYDKILLLGQDTIAAGDFGGIFDLALGDKLAAAPSGADGTLDFRAALCNLRLMRESGYPERALAEAETPADAAGLRRAASACLRRGGWLELGGEQFAPWIVADGMARPPALIGHDQSGRPWNRDAAGFSRRFWDAAKASPGYAAILERLPGGEGGTLPPASAENAPPAPAVPFDFNRKAFASLRGAFAGREVALIGGGPGAEGYPPRPGTIHIGLNRAYDSLPPGVGLDFLVATCDYLDGYMAHRPDLGTLAKGAGRGRAILALPDCAYSAEELLAIAAEADGLGIALAMYVNKYSDSSRPAFTLDLAGRLLDRGSYEVDVALLAMQIALYGRPRRILLVGIGDADLGKMHAAGEAAAARLRGDWLEMRDFARVQYPGTEIVSCGSTRLAGIFRDSEG